MALQNIVNICDKNKLKAEFTPIKDLMVQNDFAKRIRDAIINNKLKYLNVNKIKSTANNDLETIWIKIPYLGDKGDQFLRLLKAKLKHHFTKEVSLALYSPRKS